MTRAEWLIRGEEQIQRATFLELFFDLVFVFALNRLSQELLNNLGWLGWLRMLVLLLALWFVWAVTSWVTDLYNPHRPAIQLMVLATMFGGLVMSVSTPQAFGAMGLAFATAYVTIHLGRGAYLVAALRGHPLRRRAMRVMFWLAISGVPWIAGAFAPSRTRLGLWALAAAIDFTGFARQWPAPRLGRSPASDWSFGSEHLAERYRQFFIIALGELILSAGFAFGASARTAGHWGALAVAFVTAVLMWRIYIHRAGQLLAGAIAQAAEQARVGRTTTYAHLVMVIGVVITSSGDELEIGQPFGRNTPSWVVAIVGGPALFLAGRVGFERTVAKRVSWSRPAGVAVLVAIAPAMVLVPPLAAATAAAAVLAAVAVADTYVGGARQRHEADRQRVTDE